MRSSSGKHFAGLDHVRALAAFLVVTWHFVHGGAGDPVPYNGAPELALLDEGHVGVSLFMVLSGYLFAKLIAGRAINYPAFLWNRAIRLLPLLLVVLLIVGVRRYSDDPIGFLKLVVGGLVLPQLPNGGWSITAEAHFYLILPFLLWAASKSRWALLGMVAVAILIRIAIYMSGAYVMDYAYWTIVGRFDQFALGIFFCHQRVLGRWALAAFVAIAAIYAAFDVAGGFYGGLNSPWIILPTLEAVAFGAIISWYDANPIRSAKMWFFQKAGEYSYSIYLLHFFLVFSAGRFVDDQIIELNSLYEALPWAMLFFVVMVGIGHISYKLIEEPALRFRRPYIKEAASTRLEATAA